MGREPQWSSVLLGVFLAFMGQWAFQAIMAWIHLFR